jgi:hypothetical protein
MDHDLSEKLGSYGMYFFAALKLLRQVLPKSIPFSDLAFM